MVSFSPQVISTQDSVIEKMRKHPLATSIIIAAGLRLLAVIFAKGYMAMDDHFLVIRVVDYWLHGIPFWFEGGAPIARGVIYQYTLYALMWGLKQVNLTDPSIVMFIIRFLHAAWSLTIIPLMYFGLRKYADQRAAWLGTMLASIHFLMPFLAVRNLVEVVCQPFLFGGLLLLEVEVKEKNRPKFLFLGGILLGLAFMVRIQTALCPIAVFFVLLILHKWKPLLFFSLGGITVLLIQGVIDYISFGFFLSSVVYSLGYQSTIVHSFITNPWYTYILTVLGIFIPPFSILIFPWVAKTVRRLPLIFWATIFFFVIHSLIPQKQERFLLPLFPLLIFLLTVGWSMVSWREKRWVRGCWNWMWGVNLILLPMATFNYSQKARIEPLIELSKLPEVNKVVVESIENPTWLPEYYDQKHQPEGTYKYIFHPEDYDRFASEMEMVGEGNPSPYTHAIILTHQDIEAHKERLEAIFGPLTLIRHVGPSLADWILHKMNPTHNHSKESWVFKIENKSKIK